MSRSTKTLKVEKSRRPTDEVIRDANQLEMFEIEAVKKASRQQETFLTAKNTVVIRQMPYQPLRRFTIHRAAIQVGERDDYLLVGFDTEYQPDKPVFDSKDIKAGNARLHAFDRQERP